MVNGKDVRSRQLLVMVNGKDASGWKRKHFQVSGLPIRDVGEDWLQEMGEEHGEVYKRASGKPRKAGTSS